MLQGFLVVLAIYVAVVAVVVINVARSRMAVTAECIKVRLLFFHVLSLLWPALISLCSWLPSSFQELLLCPALPCPALPCPALHAI